MAYTLKPSVAVLWVAIVEVISACMGVPLTVKMTLGFLVGIPCQLYVGALAASYQLCGDRNSTALHYDICCARFDIYSEPEAFRERVGLLQWHPLHSVATYSARLLALSPCIVTDFTFLSCSAAIVTLVLVAGPVCSALLNGRHVLLHDPSQHTVRDDSKGWRQHHLVQLLFEPLLLTTVVLSVEKRFVESMIAQMAGLRALLPIVCFPVILYTFIS
jgi:hypothetical protein